MSFTSHNHPSPPLLGPRSDHTSPSYAGPPISPASHLSDNIASVFVLRHDHPALQTPVNPENRQRLVPESVTVEIDRIENESDFASDLASALGGIHRPPLENNSSIASFSSSPALPAQSSVTSTSTPTHRFRQNAGSPANSEETAAPSPVANEFVQAIQLEESVAYPAIDHGLLTGLHSRAESAIDLTQPTTVTIDLTYSPPAAAEDQPEIEIILDSK